MTFLLSLSSYPVVEPELLGFYVQASLPRLALAWKETSYPQLREPGEAGFLVHKPQVILALLSCLPMFNGYSLHSALLDPHPEASVASCITKGPVLTWGGMPLPPNGIPSGRSRLQLLAFSVGWH